MDEESYGHYARKLTKEEYDRLNSERTVSDWFVNKLEVDARKNWDLFYKRNSDNFFKNRNWTQKEFEELELKLENESNERPILLELGSGVGNFLFPLIEAKTDYFIIACDFSERAIDFIKKNHLYNETKCKAFVADISDPNFEEKYVSISENRLADVVSLIYVLSSINPDKMQEVFRNCFKVLKPNGKVILRDYALYDHAMLRFKPENKISDNLYYRIDGTRAYYFSEKFLFDLAKSVGFDVIENRYVVKETINIKEGIHAQRVFIQSKFIKPSDSV